MFTISTGSGLVLGALGGRLFFHKRLSPKNYYRIRTGRYINLYVILIKRKFDVITIINAECKSAYYG